MKDLDALRAADLDWVRQLDSVWRDCAYDVAGLHEDVRKEFQDKIIAYAAAEERLSPLGWVIEGAAGIGKTHLVGVFRKLSTDMGANFVLVDMTDIHDFWETVLQGFWSSLQQPFEGGKLQSELILESLLRKSGVKKSKVRKIADLSPAKRDQVTGQVLSYLIREYPQEGLLHQDVVRGLILFNSNDLPQKNVGFCWLQGLPIEEADKAAYRFNKAQAKPTEIVRGLSWIMSLRGLTVLVFDQIDAIVNQHHLTALSNDGEAASDAQRASKSIIEGLAGGLLAVHGLLTKNLSIVACLQSTWEILKKEVLSPATDRYEVPRQLNRIGDTAVARQLIAGRLGPAFERMAFKPPYPTYPFTETFFEQAANMSPRELLKRCEEHRRVCLRKDRVIEIGRLESIEPGPQPAVDGYRGLESPFRKAADTGRSRSPGPRGERGRPPGSAPANRLLLPHYGKRGAVECGCRSGRGFPRRPGPSPARPHPTDLPGRERARGTLLSAGHRAQERRRLPGPAESRHDGSGHRPLAQVPAAHRRPTRPASPGLQDGYCSSKASAAPAASWSARRMTS